MLDPYKWEEDLFQWVRRQIPDEVDKSWGDLSFNAGEPFAGILNLLDSASEVGKLPRMVMDRLLEEYPEPVNRAAFDFYPVDD